MRDLGTGMFYHRYGTLWRSDEKGTAVGIEEQPGYLGFTSRGVIAIHADWPAYPIEHGWHMALVMLGSFPQGMKFKLIDDIDRCALFLVLGFREYEDPFDERAYHVAIWHEDLLEANRLGLVGGVEPLTERKYEERRRDEMRADFLSTLTQERITPPTGDILSTLYFEHDGQRIPFRLPSLDSYEDEDEDGEYDGRRLLGITQEGTVSVTPLGWSRLEEVWADSLELPAQLASRLNLLIDNGLYDTAVRDLGVAVESRMREMSGSTTYGQRLVNDFIGSLLSLNIFMPTFLKTLRTEVRTAMAFVRNEYAHNLVDLPRPRAMALIGRLCHLLHDFDDVEAAMADSQSD
jgi:hypothetical protein